MKKKMKKSRERERARSTEDFKRETAKERKKKKKRERDSGKLNEEQKVREVKNERKEREFHRPGINGGKEGIESGVHNGPGMSDGTRTECQGMILGHHSSDEADPHVDTMKAVVDLIAVLQAAPARRQPERHRAISHPRQVNVGLSQHHQLKKRSHKNK